MDVSRPKAISPAQLQASRKQWLTQFNHAFALMTVIPLLIVFYLITARMFSLSVLEGLNGIYFLFAILMALLGLLAGRGVIQGIIRQLTRTNEQLQRFQTLQAEFVSNVAHELRSPLSIMKGAMENLSDGLYGTLNVEQREVVQITDQEAARLMRVVRDLLDIGQIEAERLLLKPQPLVLQDLLKDVTKLCTQLSKERGLRLDLETPSEPIHLHADSDRLKQVFINLVMNAIKFTKEGGIQVRCARNGNTVQIEIADTGEGISAENCDRIFKKFERVGNQLQEGSGLGLPIAKAIVELHGGRMWVESEIGSGSQFFVQLQVGSSDGVAEADKRSGGE